VSLRSAISTPDGKRRFVRRVFATIADRYDFITVVLSYGRDRSWKLRLIDLARLRGDDRVLDLACGTGDLLFAAAAATQRAIGLDVTLRMLQLADLKQRERPGARVPLVAGDMVMLPFSDGRFSVVTTGYGLRNVPDLPGAIREIHRVLARGGRLLSLDFNRPENRVLRTIYLGYLSLVGAMLGVVLHRDPDMYRYIPESIRTYPGARGVAQLLTEAGFEDVRVIPLLGGLMAIHTAQRG
jgi:demethylmenaquinone methyltransferase/2-methoxy-6-polyprenyl-1,4-benzoquinol methylase